MNYLNSIPSENVPAILDSIATGNFLEFDVPCMNAQIAMSPMEFKLPNGDFIRSIHTATADIPELPLAVREAHIFPNHFQHSLSVGKLCDIDCEVNFLSRSATVKVNGDIIVMGNCDYAPGIWRFNLEVSPLENSPMPSLA
jgi:hypothetical protein